MLTATDLLIGIMIVLIVGFLNKRFGTNTPKFKVHPTKAYLASCRA